MALSIFKCIDGHTCGNPVRLITSGGPDLVGKDMNEKRLHFMRQYDWIRRGLMYEPRGHDMMSGSIIYEPHDPDNDFSILFVETSGCLPMCGHGTIGTITFGIQEGLINPKAPGKIKMEAPAGLVEIDYKERDGKVLWVRLKNVKSYLAAEGLTVDCPDLGELVFDVAYGGNFYAIVDPQNNYRGLEEFTAGEIIKYSQVVRKRINEKYPDFFVHPENDSISGASHMLWTGKPLDPKSSGRNAVFYGDKAIDRSPCGTGTSARLAQLHAKGKIKKGEAFIHESYIGSTFIGKVEEETNIKGIPAIVPSIQGWAKVTGYNTLIIDEEDDPYAYGFQVL
ncbi:4-hydroxyproline epimerase [Lutimonas vermicola]|uniref:4-hydroxyproline epimerase n=1 Tax=Lutimonas vermicola TaxID=414288 RepID=A0ABU9L1G8_9FLAO